MEFTDETVVIQGVGLFQVSIQHADFLCFVMLEMCSLGSFVLRCRSTGLKVQHVCMYS